MQREYQIVKICALFRDASAYVDRYLRQLESLDYPKENLKFVFLEGDSTDDTYARLATWCSQHDNTILVRKNVNHPKYGHVRDLDRTKLLADLRNAITTIDVGEDYVFWIESDMIFESDTLKLLFRGLSEANADIIAPIIFDSPLIPKFFDIWSYRKNGKEFSKEFPYCEGLTTMNTPFAVDSVGAVTLTKASVYRSGVRYDTGDSDVAVFCMNARKHGFARIFVDPRVVIWHGEPENVPQQQVAKPPHYIKRVLNRQLKRIRRLINMVKQ